MQIRINVKGASRKKASIIQQVREYPDTCMTVEEFLAETVRQNVKEYNARKDAGAEKLLAGLLGEQDSVPAGIAATTKAVPPGPEASQNAETLEKQLEDRIQAGAQVGKVSYGDPMDDRKADAEKAVLNALQCFDDGIVALFADWFSPADTESPTLEYVSFYDRKTGKQKKLSEVPDILYSEVMRDVDLAVSVAHVGGVDPETSQSTIEMRRVIFEFNMELFGLANVTFEGTHAFIKGTLNSYNIQLGSGVIHKESGGMVNILPVHSQQRGKIFLPFIDEDPRTAEILSKILLLAEDHKIKDPYILQQLR